MNDRNSRLASLCIAWFLCFGIARGGQPIPPLSTPPVSLVPVLQVRGAEQPVRLQSLAIKTDIQSGFAEISLDMVFFNPNNRILEGELHFPLLPGQEISGLALDIGGEMRSAVPVPKARGQEIFEAVARRKVDPALLEATQGNAYKLRVYPIPAGGTRRVIVRILQPLTEQNGMFTLRMPLAFAKNIDAFSVEALVAAAEPPQVDSGSLGLVLEQAGLLYRGKVEKSNLSPEGWLVISVPAPATPDKGFNAVRWQDKIYFSATASIAVETRKRELPKTVTIVWDASGSGRNRDHAREYALLDKYFTALGDGQVRVVVVRNVAETAKEFPVRQSNWSAVKAYLHGLDYDGGTDLASRKPTEDCVEYLLFTDGLANLGNSREDAVLPAMLPGQRLYAVTASNEADHNLLRHASAGRLVDLLRHNDDAAAQLLLEDRTGVSLAPAELAGKGEVLLDPLASSAEKDSKCLQYRLAGWIKARDNAQEETITLQLEHPDGKQERLSLAIPLHENIPLHKGEEAPLPARLWGRYAITGMETNAARHKAAIARLGQELGIVSKETSLIVLETTEDYARYDVAPPASLKTEVERLRAMNKTADTAVSYLSTKQLEKMWKEKVAWWEQDFNKKPVKKKEIRSEPLAQLSMGGTDSSRDREQLAETLRHLPQERRAVPPSAPAETRPSAEADLYTYADSAAMDMSMAYSESPAPSASAAMAASSDQSYRRVALPEPAPIAQDAKEDNKTAAMGIALQAWKSDAPYIERMNKAKKEDMYAIYLDEQPNYDRSSAFYLDMADRFFARDMPELGLRVLSNLAEIEVENRQLLRVLAYRLLEAKEIRLALGILEKVRELAPYEPQSLRDLAVAHKARGNFQEAADLLYEVARREWDERFTDVNVIALTELNALIATSGNAVNTASFDNRLLKNLPSDLRVVLTWDTDNTDMDLWVTDPDGEKCSYENRLTKQGGAMSRDCTEGYGPEEFMLKKAKSGAYRVEVDYYGSSQQVLSGEVTLYITLTTGFGTSGQEEQVITMRLKGEKSKILVGEFTVQ